MVGGFCGVRVSRPSASYRITLDLSRNGRARLYRVPFSMWKRVALFFGFFGGCGSVVHWAFGLHRLFGKTARSDRLMEKLLSTYGTSAMRLSAALASARFPAPM